MEIHSAFNAGVQGFQKATEEAYKAADNIATSVGITPETYGIGQKNNGLGTNDSAATAATLNSQNNTPSVNLTQSIVDLRVAEFQAKASADVIQSADDNLGTLLDVRV